MSQTRLPEHPTAPGGWRPGRVVRGLVLVGYFLVFWVVVPWALIAAGWWLDLELGWSWDERWLRPRTVGGWGLMLAGGGLLLASIDELRRRGRGMPVSALPPPRLVFRGPYRLARHPIYLGFNLVLLGHGLLQSPALAALVAPAFLPIWLGYALLEERGLRRRFGSDYDAYAREVGLLPRFKSHRFIWAAMRLRLFPTRLEGAHHIPGEGPAILVFNHVCYLDPLFAGFVTRRHVTFATTAEAYRKGLMRWLVRTGPALPVRRYRPDPIACRDVLRRLSAGRVVGIFVEGERSPLGEYGGAVADVAGIVGRLPVPVIPVGLSGAYDVGPRWAGKLRRRPVTMRVGPPLDFDGRDPRLVIDEGISALLSEQPERATFDGLDRNQVERVLWRCPRCLDEAAWEAEALKCHECGLSLAPTPEGRLASEGTTRTLAAWARPVWAATESNPLEVDATGWRERSMYGPIEPLLPLGFGALVIDGETLRFGELTLPLTDVRSTSTERADTLQVATREGMWQFRLVAGSAFRLQRAVDRWKAELESGT
jgi:1-acyl-sn-glycerol-3-phosphate acyltransferase